MRRTNDAEVRANGAAGRQGFTLVELLIALVVTMLLIGMVLVTFTAQNQLYRRQHDVGRTQQNLRLAMEIITKDIALAGFGAGGDGVFRGALPDGDNDSQLEVIRSANNYLSAGPDAIYLTYMDPNRDNWGFIDRSQAAANGAEGFLCNTSDLYFSEESKSVAENFQSGTHQWSKLACFANAGNLGLGVGYVWELAGNGNPGSGHIPVQSNSSYDDYSDVCDSSRYQALPKEMVCSRLVQVAYYVDSDGDDAGPGSGAVPYLMLDFDEDLDDGGNEVPIAPGIEDLQLAYCQLDQDCDALEWGSRYDVPTPYTFANLSRVRVRLTARSEREAEFGMRASEQPSLDLSHVPGASEDSYHRRVAHQIVVLRNARAAWEIASNY